MQEKSYLPGLKRERVRLIFGQLPGVLAGTLIIVISVLHVLRGQFDDDRVSIWCLSILLVTTIRYLVYRRFMTISSGAFNSRRWGNIFLAWVGLAGLAWGSAGWFLFVEGDPYRQAFLAIVMGSLSAATIVSHSAVILGPAVFSYPVVIPITLRYIVEGTDVSVTIGILALCYCIALTAFSRRIYRSTSDSIILRFENIELLEELRKGKKMAESATLLKDKFVSLVSHDLRSALSVMKNSLDVVYGKVTKYEDNKISGELKKTVSTLDSLLLLLSKLLDVTRLRSGEIEIHARFVNVAQIVERQIEHLLPAAERKGISLKSALPNPMRLYADPELFGQAINNLLSNAIKFSHERGVVKVSSPDNDGTTIIVEDSGVGIEKERRGNLFDNEVLTSTEGTHGERGTGLGLPYVNDIINSHGGNIEIDSKLGIGTSFHITLPMKQATVLIVDDLAEHRVILSEILADIIDVHVVHADNGVDALEQLRSMPSPNLIVSDIKMDKMDGWRLLENIRAMPNGMDIPFILASSYLMEISEDEAREKAIDLGANDFLTKPYIPEEVNKRIARFFG